MYELLGTLGSYSADDPKPVIMVGDFNSSSKDVPGFGYMPEDLDDDGLPLPDAEGTFYVPPYMQATMLAGYLDSWLEQDKYDDGFTSGFEETIDEPNDELETRIDHIFLNPEYLTVDKVKSDVVGDDPSEMVPNDLVPDALLWPSDHAGVVGKIKFLP